MQITFKSAEFEREITAEYAVDDDEFYLTAIIIDGARFDDLNIFYNGSINRVEEETLNALAKDDE